MTLQDVELALPNGRVLLEDVDLVIEPASGWSSRARRAAARPRSSGCWPACGPSAAAIRIPRSAKALFLPQKPYIPIGTLKEALCYPDKPDAHDDQTAAEILAACELGPFADRLHESANWAMAMSPGEQQRLAFARALLVKPDWLFLDEATSAWTRRPRGDVPPRGERCPA